MKPGDIIGSYVLDRRLGKGVTASTWLARQAQPGTADAGQNQSTGIVLKIFDIAETDSWKPLDQFKREADILRTLSHPQIPQYIESFDAVYEGHFLFVLVMEYIEGETVESYIASGKKFTEGHIEQILAELADILAYIGSLRPPIVHRDINPRNVIVKPDGHIELVDFSGVQDAIRTALYPGATLVGTAGYIPVEQVSGRATNRSDLYGAAATAVFMLTGRNPAELPMRNLKIDLSGLLYMSPRLSYVLDNWLDPDPDRRFLSASQSASILRGEITVPGKENLDGDAFDHLRQSFHASPQDGMETFTKPDEVNEYPSALPSDSRLEIQSLDPGLYIKLPRGGQRGATRGFSVFPVVFLGFVFFWTTMTMRMRAPIFFPLFSIPFWIVGITMVKALLKPSVTDSELFITPDGVLKKSTSFLSNSAQQFRISDTGKAKVRRSSMQMNNRVLKELAIEAGTGTLTFGLGLSDRELYFLEKRVNEELSRLKQLSAPPTSTLSE